MRPPNVRSFFHKPLVWVWPDAGYPVDTIATFSCFFGFAVKGPASITCLTSGSWSIATTPTCEQSNVIDCLDS